METNMANGNRDDVGWKTRLEELENLREEALIDKNAAWDKLHLRLRREPRKLRLAWYWAAAACLLLWLIMPATIPDTKQISVKRNFPQLKGSVSPESFSSKKTAVVTVSLVKAYRTKIVQSTYKIAKQNRLALINLANNNQPVFSKNTVIGNMKHAAPLPNPALDSSLPKSLLALAPVKKKLKVVHINELGDMEEETPAIAEYYERHSFKVKLLNQEVYTSSLPLSKNAVFTIFKTKLSPSN